eukprot:NODE_2890_length_486_cov_99.047354_g2840_i0.p1 GENE.NODE_2890_length_486_cov_99.047354_g2840_i0~~NODE_2890_length_486_cov_99.047354_g2840_i0.p1  ORF type:complete len:100 (+),score=16.62 NODE_2890_length_486_cov_99.047354_g2840_i0:80-379(+)
MVLTLGSTEVHAMKMGTWQPSLSSMADVMTAGTGDFKVESKDTSSVADCAAFAKGQGLDYAMFSQHSINGKQCWATSIPVAYSPAFIAGTGVDIALAVK